MGNVVVKIFVMYDDGVVMCVDWVLCCWMFVVVV